MSAVTLQTVLNCPSLPSLPSVAVEVLELTRDESVKLQEIARVVQQDQALTAEEQDDLRARTRMQGGL